MTRRRKLATDLVTHAETGQELEVRHMEGGGFVLGLPNPDPARPQRWALSGMFTGGKSGTNLSVILVDDEREAEPAPREFHAGRDTDGNVRLRDGSGLLVARRDDTREDVARWFVRSNPGTFREQYRAALHLLDREREGDAAELATHPDERDGRASS